MAESSPAGKITPTVVFAQVHFPWNGAGADREELVKLQRFFAFDYTGIIAPWARERVRSLGGREEERRRRRGFIGSDERSVICIIKDLRGAHPTRGRALQV